MNKYDKIFGISESTELDQRLEALILKRIKQRQTSLARWRFGAYSTLTIGAIVALIPSIKSLVGTANQNGEFEFISLLTSDTQYFLANWKSLIVSVLESLPVNQTIITLVLLLVGVSSLRQLVKYHGIIGTQRPPLFRPVFNH